VLTAILFGLAASSALVIGAVIGSYWDPPREVTGVLLAFASGALISALAFELFEEAYALGGATRSGLALLAGAAAFVAADTALDRYVAGESGPARATASAGRCWPP
jgi:zinc transporter, ZIP family